MERKRELRLCENCKTTFSGDFKKVVDLQNSGLVIYIHRKQDKSVQKNVKKNDSIVLYNTGDRVLKRADYIRELCQYKTKCYRCKNLIQYVRGLLDEIADIRQNEALGKCEHCKRNAPGSSCKRCDYIVNRFLSNKVKQYEVCQQRFKVWLSKVKVLLQGILEGDTMCRHKLYQKSTSTEEMDRLLRELRSPLLSTREPDIEIFPITESDVTGSLESLSENRDMIEELIFKLKSDGSRRRYLSDESLYLSPSQTAISCACKYFMDKKFQERRSVEVLTTQSSAEKNEPKIEILKVSTDIEKSVAVIKNKSHSSVRTVTLDEKPNIANVITDKANANLDKEKTLKVIPSTELSKVVNNDLSKSSPKELSKIPITESLKPLHKELSKLPFKEKPKAQLNELHKVPLTELSKDITKSIKEQTTDKKKSTKKTVGEKENLSPQTKYNAKEKISKEKSVKEQVLEEKPKEDKSKKPTLNSGDDMLTRLMKQRIIEKEKEPKVKKEEKPKLIPKIESLPVLKKPERIVVDIESSASVIKCGTNRESNPTEMVKGSDIVAFNAHYKNKETNSFKTLLFKSNPICLTPIINTPSVSTTTNTNLEKTKKSKTKQPNLMEEDPRKGIIKYELSDRKFIDKGWTKLPITKIMRRMNIYKMMPVNPKNNWFSRHKNRKILLYDTGETFAEIDDNGCGRWYYRNGSLALDYYNAKEINAQQRYIVYSSGEKDESGQSIPFTVLASFDYLGNGVIYDNYGNVRLKYNQSEGILIDNKIGPPGRWKWHTLNDPPVLQPVFIDTHVKSRSECLEEFFKRHKDDHSDVQKKRQPNDEMLAIELENFVKEKAHKLLQKFKPFQIRMKVLKINKYFSLRIIDQSNIYLLFRDGFISHKLNLGMLLMSNEIVDTDTAEMSQVATPYDRKPPRSQSVADIQNTLMLAKKMGKMRNTPNWTSRVTS